MESGFGCSGVIQHLEHQQLPMQQSIASPLHNFISSGMFKSFHWKGPLLVSSLPAEAFDTFPAHWIINLLPLCHRPILDNPPCIVKRSERKRGRQHILPLPPSSLSLCVVDTHRQTHVPCLERVSTIRGVPRFYPQICQTPTSWPSNSIKTSLFLSVSFLSHSNVSHHDIPPNTTFIHMHCRHCVWLALSHLLTPTEATSWTVFWQ